MFPITSRFVRRSASARWCLAAGAAALFSAAALTACGPREVSPAAAGAPSAEAAREGTPVPPAPTAALAPAAAVAPPPMQNAPAVGPAAQPMPPAPMPVPRDDAAPSTPQPVANADDLARPAPVPPRNARVAHRDAAAAGRLGSIDRIEPIHQRPQGTGAGAVLGGVAGAVIGNQFGHGLGRAAMTGLGAAGGAVAGNNVERNVLKTVVGYRVQVRLDDGSTRTFERSHVGDLHAGDRVRVGRDGLHRA